MIHIAKWGNMPLKDEDGQSGVYSKCQVVWLSKDHRYRCKVCGKVEYSVYDFYHPTEVKGLSKIHFTSLIVTDGEKK